MKTNKLTKKQVTELKKLAHDYEKLHNKMCALFTETNNMNFSPNFQAIRHHAYKVSDLLSYDCSILKVFRECRAGNKLV